MQQNNNDNAQLTLHDIHIGDWVCEKDTQFPMYVVAIFNDGTLNLDFEGNEGGLWETTIQDVERCPQQIQTPDKLRIGATYYAPCIVQENPLHITSVTHYWGVAPGFDSLYWDMGCVFSSLTECMEYCEKLKEQSQNPTKDNMGNLNVALDKFELIYLLEGCAGKSHLRQHIWGRLINEWIPQMDDKQLDFTWWVLFRDVWGKYFNQPNASYPSTGAGDFLQAMAALNRNNRYTVEVSINNRHGEKNIKLQCYRYQTEFYTIGETFKGSCLTQLIRPEELVDYQKNCVLNPDEAMFGNLYRYWKNTVIYYADPDTLLNLPAYFLSRPEITFGKVISNEK